MKVSPLFLGLGLGALALAASGGGSGGGRGFAFDPLSGGTGGGVLEDDDPPESEGEPEYEQGEDVVYDYSGLPEPTNERHEEMRFYLEEARLHPYWIVFFEAMAANESNFKNYVGLGNPALFPSWTKPSVNASQFRQDSEYEAAITAYERNAEYFAGCGIPVSAYIFGSGGWYALLPANGLKAFVGTSLQCLSPDSVFDKGASVVMIIEMVRRLMRWSGWKASPTFANLRAGLKNPSSMGDPAAIAKSVDKDHGLYERYEQIGANTELIYLTPPPLPPKNPVGMFEYLTSL